jgi:two-component system nitrogen regulation response regulator GlnG
MTHSILLVEDDMAIGEVIVAALEAEGYAVDHCVSVAARDSFLAHNKYSVLLSDVMLTDGDGISSLANALVGHEDLPVIILSAQNTLDTAVRASDAGAFEYFPKPFDLDELISAVAQAIANRKSIPDSAPRQNADSELPLVGRSPAMQNVYRMITRVLRNDLSVSILGESGTGKELVAEAIHHLGHRKANPFVAVNMAAIPSELIESELFGHEKGAFTGAVQQSIGKFEQANGGTLFLDEIGDMPMQAQTRLLRTLQTGRISRVGGHKEIDLDVRIVTATNKSFDALIAEGKFREDLYYRINVVPIELPPLRERASDIPALVEHFLALAVHEGLPRRRFSSDALDVMQRQPWRGNVRELRNLVFRTVAFSRDDVIGADALAGFDESPRLADDGAGQRIGGAGFEPALLQILTHSPPKAGHVYNDLLSQFERPLLIHALDHCGGNQLKAAQYLGINRNTLRKKLVDHAIDAAELR